MAKDVVRNLYPETKGRNLSVVIKDNRPLDDDSELTAFDLNVCEPQSEVQNRELCPRLLVSVQFAFSQKDDRLFLIGAAGPLVRSDERAKVTDLVNAHMEWSDEQIAAALKSAGARFGPDEEAAFRKRLPFAALKLLLGPVRVGPARFTLRDPQQVEAHLPAAILLWDVEITSHTPGKPSQKYFALFEPFEGKLISLQKVPPIP